MLQLFHRKTQNSVTEETTWDPPEEGYNPPSEDEGSRDDDDDAEETKGAEEFTSSPTATVGEETADRGKSEEEKKIFDWSAVRDDDGRVYYYNRYGSSCDKASFMI